MSNKYLLMPFISGILLLITANQTIGQNKLQIIPDTGQTSCYNNYREISCPGFGEAFFGQDAQYKSNPPAYKDNGDGTITDLNTGLMWSKSVNNTKVSIEEANKIAKNLTLGGYDDWRVPTIKELYSLIDFKGYTGFDRSQDLYKVPSNAVPYINTDYFDFKFGKINEGERYIDAQWLSSTKYVSTTMDGAETLFGVNFADGRIKGYGYKKFDRVRKKFYVRYVRGPKTYGVNKFIDNDDGTVTDLSTGLMWMKKDSGKGMNWQKALEYAENLEYAGHKDWRLPDAKELQYIVDYSRSPNTTKSPAIDAIFETTTITNEAGQKDYPFFWTSTTHLDGPSPGNMAAYISFGRAIGQMHGYTMDVHGAGAQRSDPKTGYAQLGQGPQGDARRVNNFVKCVRGGSVKLTVQPTLIEDPNKYPTKIKIQEGTNSKNFENNSPQSPFIKRLDKNGDNMISRSEFDGPPERFDYHDLNRDGYISEDELYTLPHNR